MSLFKMAMAKKIGGAKSYNDLKDKPFGEVDMPELAVDIHFDANAWHEMLNYDEDTYFVSDKVFTKEELLSNGCPFYMELRNAGGDTVISTIEVSKATLYVSNAYIRISIPVYTNVGQGNASIYVVSDCDNAYFFDAYMPAPKNGIYFSFSTYYDYRVERLYRSSVGTKTIDNKYLDLTNHPVIQEILSKI